MNRDQQSISNQISEKPIYKARRSFDAPSAVCVSPDFSSPNPSHIYSAKPTIYKTLLPDFATPAGKRRVSQLPTSIKRVKTKPSPRLQLSLKFQSQTFRCFPDHLAVDKNKIRERLIPCEGDDDCATDAQQLDLGSSYVLKQLKLALIEYQLNGIMDIER